MKKALLMIGACSLLGGCGVKPDNIKGDPAHPATYPDVRTDPIPGGGVGSTR